MKTDHFHYHNQMKKKQDKHQDTETIKGRLQKKPTSEQKDCTVKRNHYLEEQRNNQECEDDTEHN